MTNLQLSIAIGPYDHVRDLLDGTIRAAGIDLTVLRLQPEEIFYRFTRFREWDVSEMSFAKVISLASQDEGGIVALPVFPSRVFRHSSIYVRAGSSISSPAQLAGKRIGVPEWAQTASVYSRGMLQHEYGVDLKSIHWHQAGVNEAGRVEKVKLNLPDGLRLAVVKDRSLSEMLLAGDLDAVLSARPPAPFEAGDKRIARLFPDYRAVELPYWRKTGIFPIMHVVVVRRDVYERHRWVAMNLFKAFEAAKNESLKRLTDLTASLYPVPWMAENTGTSQELLGGDFWPYGIAPNRTTLEAFARYAWEQGICHRRVTVEELFPPEVQTSFKV